MKRYWIFALSLVVFSILNVGGQLFGLPPMSPTDFILATFAASWCADGIE